MGRAHKRETGVLYDDFFFRTWFENHALAVSLPPPREASTGNASDLIFGPPHVYSTVLGSDPSQELPPSTPTPSRAESGERRRDRPVTHQSPLSAEVRRASGRQKAQKCGG